jgi:ATP-dependent Lhr-like helicase
MEEEIEPLCPPRNCMDILAQHLVSMAAEGVWTVEDAAALVRRCDSFAGITAADVDAVLRMLSGDWEHAREHPVRARLLYDRIHGTFTGDAYSRMLATSSGGTIPDRGWYAAVLADGTRLGELDEEFVFEARIGDRFLLGSFSWAITEFGHDRVVVAPAPSGGAQAPFWRGDGRGRAYAVGCAFGAKMRALGEAAGERGGLVRALRAMHADEWAAENAARVLREQTEHTGCLPDDRTVILEHFSDEAGEH